MVIRPHTAIQIDMIIELISKTGERGIIHTARQVVTGEWLRKCFDRSATLCPFNPRFKDRTLPPVDVVEITK
jgi:hypothetical protein